MAIKCIPATLHSSSWNGIKSCDLYTIDIVHGTYDLKRVDGTGGRYAMDSCFTPPEVKTKYRQMLKSKKAKNG